VKVFLPARIIFSANQHRMMAKRILTCQVKESIQKRKDKTPVSLSQENNSFGNFHALMKTGIFLDKIY